MISLTANLAPFGVPLISLWYSFGIPMESNDFTKFTPAHKDSLRPSPPAQPPESKKIPLRGAMCGAA